jgi:hypothetical protein
MSSSIIYSCKFYSNKVSIRGDDIFINVLISSLSAFLQAVVVGNICSNCVGDRCFITSGDISFSELYDSDNSGCNFIDCYSAEIDQCSDNGHCYEVCFFSFLIYF